jgi:UDP-N-acetylglucosamine 2-epimerase (non-hydrolysing)
MNLLQDAQFVISDGGSNQEECSYLGIPVLLLRDVTERKEGLGENIVISHYNKAIITDFIANIAKYRKAPSIDSLGSPTEIIVEHCLKYVGKS